MKKSKTLESLCEDEKMLPGSEPKSFREIYEQKFRQWLDSDVELIQVTKAFRLSTVREAAQLCVDYFTTQMEQGRPLVISGLTLALKFTSNQALDMYKTYHEDYASLIDTAKQLCEQYAEEQLYSKNSSGAKFVLMNRNKWSYQEKQEVTTHNLDVRI
jgi:hypothetical protein